MIWFLIFMIINMINSILFISVGCDCHTWQWWLGTICVCGSYILGCMKGMTEANE